MQRAEQGIHICVQPAGGYIVDQRSASLYGHFRYWSPPGIDGNQRVRELPAQGFDGWNNAV